MPRYGLVAVLSLACTASGAAQSPRATLILTNGNVLTVDAADRVAQAVAIVGNKILAVGTTAEIERFAGAETKRIDLHGRTVTPGLLDAHDHFADGGTNRLLQVDLNYPAVKSIADVVAAVKARADATPKGVWIEGRGWDEGKFAEHRMIAAKDLDAITPAHPAILTNTTGHYSVVNSLALKLAGITKETKDPAGGTIDRYADGTPTGVLKENAQSVVRRLVPPHSRSDVERGIREMAKAFNAEGMTGVKDPGVSEADFALYQKVASDGALPVRVFALWRGGNTTAGARQLIASRAAITRPYESTGDDHVIAGGVKLYIDGSGGARTAWLYDEWNTNLTQIDAGNRGYPTTNADTIRAMIRLFHDAGMHVAVHSIGDHAIDWVVDTYDQAMRENPKRGLRHAIIHANLPSDHAIDVMARLQHEFDAGYPEPSATFLWWLGDNYAGNFGAARAKRLNPFATYLKRGITWANGSDYYVTPFPARYGIWVAIAREPLLGVYGNDVFGRAESVDAHAALRAVTIWAARQMFLERKIGSIEPDKYADLAVWDRDFYAVPTAQIKDARCELTIFDGTVVFARAIEKE